MRIWRTYAQLWMHPKRKGVENMVKNRLASENSKAVSETKIRIPLWIYPSTEKLMERLITYDNCKSPSEFIEKAIHFYVGYISEKDSSRFLSKTLTTIMRGMLDDTENRIATLLFKQTVEMAILMNVVAAMADVDDETLRKLRIKCVEDAKRTNGSISLAQVVRAQRESR